MDLVALKYHSRGREGLKNFAAGGASWGQIDASDVAQIPGLARALALWRIRSMVVQ